MPLPHHRDCDVIDPATPGDISADVIVPNPAVLQEAVDRYQTLAADGDAAADIPLQNAVYTLCVLTGTRTLEGALAAVRRLCPRPVPPDRTPESLSRQAVTLIPSGSASRPTKVVT